MEILSFQLLLKSSTKMEKKDLSVGNCIVDLVQEDKQAIGWDQLWKSMSAWGTDVPGTDYALYFLLLLSTFETVHG